VVEHWYTRHILFWLADQIAIAASTPSRIPGSTANSSFRDTEFNRSSADLILIAEGCGSNFLLILPLVNRIRVFIMYSPRIVIHPN
jgi:hypothetical protein